MPAPGWPFTRRSTLYFSAPISTRATSLSRTLEPLGIGLEHDLAELLGVCSLRLRGDRRVQHLLVGLRQAADLARGDLGVLRLDRRDHVARHQRERRQPLRVEPDAHRVRRAEHVDVADSGHARQRVLDVRREIVRHVHVVARSVAS